MRRFGITQCNRIWVSRLKTLIFINVACCEESCLRLVEFKSEVVRLPRPPWFCAEKFLSYNNVCKTPRRLFYDWDEVGGRHRDPLLQKRRGGGRCAMAGTD